MEKTALLVPVTYVFILGKVQTLTIIQMKYTGEG